VVSRHELLSAIWPGVIVGDDALTQAVIKLRRALADEARSPAYIETVSKRGYRLIATVKGASASPAPARESSRFRPIAVVSTIAVAAVAAVAFVSGDFEHGPSPTTPGPSPLPVVAVLPLTNAAGDAKRDYLVDGFTDEMINALGRF